MTNHTLAVLVTIFYATSFVFAFAKAVSNNESDRSALGALATLSGLATGVFTIWLVAVSW